MEQLFQDIPIYSFYCNTDTCDVRVVEAGQLMADPEQVIGRAHGQIDAAIAMVA